MADILDIFNCCDICGEDHPTEQCPELGEIPAESQLGGYVTKARLTLPNSLKVYDSKFASVGVIATEFIPEKTQLGPFEAKRTTHVFDDTGFFTLKLVAKDGNTVCLDTTDENECNWMCLVRPAVSEETRNCMAYQLGTNIYYNTTQDIDPGVELQVWYTATYARKLGKPTTPDGVSKALLGHRIEPIQTDLVIEPLTDTPSESTDQHEQVQQQSGVSEGDKELRGEIKKGFYCPRCGNTFDSQSEMVQHLREHVITGSKTLPVNNKRGKGRPRIHPIVTDSSEPSVKRPRGRPRKSRPIEVYIEMDTDEKPIDPGTRDDNVDGDNTENEDFDELIGLDEEDKGPLVKRFKSEHGVSDDLDYSPMKDVRNSGRRVQPRRSGKGTNRQLMQDYFVGRIKKEPVEAGESLKVTNDISDLKDKIELNEGKTVVKRKRGRPKKTDQLITQIADVNGFVQNDSNNKQVEDSNAIIVKQDQNADKSLTSINNSLKDVQHNLEDVQNGLDEKNVEINKETTDSAKVENRKGTDTDEDGQDILAAVNEGSNSNSDTVNVEECGLEQEHRESLKVDLESDNLIPKVQYEDGEKTSEKATEASMDDEEESANIRQDSDTELVIHFDEESEIYTCSRCNEEFKQQIDAINHAVNHNNTETLLNCNICNQNFQNALELKSHVGKCKANVKSNKSGQQTKKIHHAKLNESDSGPHVCDICQQEFKTPYYLYRHMVMHTDMFTCSVCFKTFSRKDSLNKHVLKCCPQEAERLKIMHCDLCLRVFSTASGRDKHRTKCTLVQCGACGGRFSSKEDLGLHKCKDGKTDDPGAGRYSCGKCPKSFQSLHYLRQHALLHMELHACSKCGKSLPTQDELENHSITCQTIESIKQLGQGRCERCGEVFLSAKLFREHSISHTHPYQCSHCFRRFVRVGTLSSHDCMNEPYTCKTCSKPFKNAASLDRHTKDHGCLRYQCSACGNQFHMKVDARDHACEVQDGEEERKILYTSDSREVCTMCGKSFATRSNLHKHMLLHGEKNFPCPHCDKRFHLDVYLKEHITCVHYKIYKYQCPHCGKLLKSKTGLNMHNLLFHTATAETFNCPECTKVFKSKGNLKAHMYRHSTDRKFKCHICSRTFKFPDQLSRHKVEHKIIEKIACIYCEKQFCRRYELKRHLQIYHSGYVYVCGMCSAKCGHRHTLVRHYKRKHPDDYHLLSQEGYLHGLLKHVSELPGYKAPETTEPAADVVDTLPGESGLNKLIPQDAVKALQSLSLGTCTMKEYQILKEKGLIKTNENPEEPAFTDGQSVLVAQDVNVLQPQTIIQQEQLLTSTGDTITPTVMSEQIGLIQTSDGTININNIQGLPQTLETLEGNDGQIVILQIVEASDQIVSDLSQGEIIQQLQGASETIDIQPVAIQDTDHVVQDLHHTTVVSQEVQIVNFTDGMDVGNDTTVRQMDGGLLHIQNLTEEQIEQMGVSGHTVDTLQIVEDAVVENETEIM